MRLDHESHPGHFGREESVNNEDQRFWIRLHVDVLKQIKTIIVFRNQRLGSIIMPVKH